MLFRLLAAAALSVACLCVNAHEHDGATNQAKSLIVSQAWSRAMPASAPTGAAYFIIDNHSGKSDRLTSVYAVVADKTELHSHMHVNGLMRMQHVESVDILANDQVQFEPGGYHVMMFGLKQPLVAGESFSLTLEFEHAGEITTEVKIMDAAPGPHSSMR
ncbi:copper chaperone PCu(A)C [Azomonas macrocytogenes]|uniref:Copper chaperone PCu(A)C n=1 Tax=Azomonas macrocytogenes TaxID=69962 RepID=A0A839T3P4_AZOMA|nr:copper chaperone PCu(A)C [Azomonas macrocytogenes]MBB3104022.1 hypothetical protein [Azomonas macrocytogenes]